MPNKCNNCDFTSCVVIHDPNDPPGAMRTLCMLHFYGSKYATRRYSSCIQDWDKQAIRSQKPKAEKLVNYLTEQVMEKLSSTNATTAAIGKVSRSMRSRQPISSLSSSPSIDENKQEPLSSRKLAKRKRQQTWDIQKGERRVPAPVTLSNTLSITDSRQIIREQKVNQILEQLNTPDDPKRFKVCRMIGTALSRDLDTSTKNIQPAIQLALEIEQQLYEIKEQEQSYIAHARQIGQMLGDAKNENLRDKLLSNSMTPRELCLMDGSQLANPEVTRQRSEQFKKFTAQRIHKGEQEAATPTTQYICPKCNKNDTKFALVKQSRNSNKCETWGNKDNDDSNDIKLYCNSCEHTWIRAM